MNTHDSNPAEAKQHDSDGTIRRRLDSTVRLDFDCNSNAARNGNGNGGDRPTLAASATATRR